MKTVKKFRFPIFFVLLLLLASCGKDGRNQASDLRDAIRRGYDTQLKANAFLKAGETDSAFASYTVAKEYYEQGKDSMGTAYALLQLAEIYRQYNDYTELQATDVEALKWLENTDDTKYHKTLYIQLGMSYSQLGDITNAVANYEKCRAYTTQPWEKLTVDNNIANAYIFKENYTKAYGILDKARRLYIVHDTMPIKATALDNFGYATFKLGREGGEEMMFQALKLRKQTGDTLGLITNHLHLAESLLQKNRVDAVRFAVTADRLALANKSPVDRVEVLRFLIDHGDTNLSSRYAREYARVSDSLQEAMQKARNTFAAIKYDYRKEKERRLQSAIEAERERNQKLNWIIIALSFGSVGAFMIYYLIRRSVGIKQKAGYAAEVRISSQLHDELANEVHKTILFTETKDLSDRLNKETLLDRLENIYQGTRSISRDNSEIPEDKDFGTVLRELLQEYNSEDCAVIAQGIPSVNWDNLERHKKIEVYRIIQELLANMRKHSKCSHALFSFSMSGRKARITYSDNGTGNAENGQNRKNGLRIMENRISGLKGTITFESVPGKGFRAEIEFPV